MTRLLGGMAICLFLPAIGESQDANRLPIKRVVLYKNGVGYFEHLGHVKDQQDVTVSFTSAQLNDVLKSLTVIDLAPAPVVSVTYDSTKPADRQLSELGLREL